MKKTAPIILAIVLLTAATYIAVTREPAAEKAERLRADMEYKCVQAELAVKYTPATSKEEQAECDVARRKFNKFMNN